MQEEEKGQKKERWYHIAWRELREAEEERKAAQLIHACNGEGFARKVRKIPRLVSYVNEMLLSKTWRNGKKWALIRTLCNASDRFYDVSLFLYPAAKFLRADDHFFTYTKCVPYVRDVESYLEFLEGIQAMFERQFAIWMQKQPQGVTSERILTQVAVAQALQRIAEEKSGHVKKEDGELLMGETVKAPAQGKKGMYQSARRLRMV